MLLLGAVCDYSEAGREVDAHWEVFWNKDQRGGTCHAERSEASLVEQDADASLRSA